MSSNASGGRQCCSARVKSGSRCPYGRTILLAIEDVTERRQAEEAQQQHLASIVESSDDAIISKDMNGIIQTWNRGAERIFGYTAGEAVGRHISLLTAPGDKDEIPDILERVSRGERVDHYQTRQLAKDGRILSVSLTVSPLRDDAGRHHWCFKNCPRYH